MIKLIKDFLTYRKLVESFDVKELTPQLKYKIKNENAELEKELNDVLLLHLARRIIRDDLSSEWAT